MKFFRHEIPERDPWTELIDAKGHLLAGERFLSVISLQNGVYYLGRRGLHNRQIELSVSRFLFPESEFEVITKSKTRWFEFHELYRKVHNVNAS